MKVHARISADAVDRCVYIDLQNIEDQPFKRYKFLPEKIDDDLLERLARLLIREESKLVEIKLSDDVRDELRRKLALEKRRNEEALAEADQADEAAEADAEAAAWAARRFTRKAKKRTQKGGWKINKEGFERLCVDADSGDLIFFDSVAVQVI